jgi:hypothetical protein
VGLVAIVFGFTAGDFYAAFMRRPRPDERPVPKWVGRTSRFSTAFGTVLFPNLFPFVVSISCGK